MDPVLKHLSERCCGKADQKIINGLSAFRANNPAAFAQFRTKIDAYPGTAQIPESIVINYHAEALLQALAVKTTFSGVKGLNEAFSGIAKITNSNTINRAVTFSQQVVGFTEQCFNLGVAVQTSAGYAAIGGPALMLATIGMQLCGSFMSKSGPTTEQVMLQQLQAISLQIEELGSLMINKFARVHQHLELLFETLCECTDDLQFLIHNEISSFRADATTRLDRVTDRIKTLLKLTDDAVNTILTQSLKEQCVKSNARMQMHASSNEKADVQDIVDMLEHGWILNQSALPVLTGASKFVAGNSQQSQTNDIDLISINVSTLQNILGYMAKVANEMGLDLTGDDKDAVDKSKIINPEVFDIALTEYLKLRRTFPSYVIDDDDGSKYTRINAFAQNTINFIRKVQSSRDLFRALFANYNNAISALAVITEQQTQNANAKFCEDYKTTEVDLISSYDQIMRRVQPRLPMVFEDPESKIKPEAQLRYGHITVNSLPFSSEFAMPPEIAVLQILGLATLEGSFSIPQMEFLSPLGFNAHYPFPPHGNVGHFTGELNLGLLQQHIADCRWNIDTRRNFLNPKDEYTVRLHQTYGYSYNISLNFALELSDKSFRRTFSAQGTTSVDAIAPKLPAPKSLPFDTVRKILKFGSIQLSDNNDTSLEAIAIRIKNAIVEARKQKIVTPLFDGSNKAFENALLHLESAKLRLAAFSMIAGLPRDIHDRIMQLPGQDEIKAELRNYNMFAVMDTTPWVKPELSTLQDDCYANLSEGTPPPTLNSEILNNIRKFTAQVALHRVMHKNSRGSKTTARIIPDTPEERARELGFKIELLEINLMQHAGLITAITNNDEYRVSRKVSKTLNLAEELTVKGHLALHLAAYIGNSKVVKILLDSDRTVIDTRDDDGFTALMYSVLADSLEAVTCLTEAGADYKIKNRHDQSAIDLAYIFGRTLIHDHLVNIANAAPRASSARAGRSCSM
jgi:hypothetical protein